ncbi:hypothetical protein [Enhygromyxa salina]|uniref:Uncharacterized protein n=1 Tax=Enhygromyxa salina TaxID=215803 RepID=A0A2S9XWU7_9BACT|nr:hypothetical protein [Enhygromyxa salina]PRP97348.1 hypothetical protein ENSA7_66980 [Enhygromyxa salina]
MALIRRWVGGRSPTLPKAVMAAAKKNGKVEVDHGDTASKTPDAGPYDEKMWGTPAPGTSSLRQRKSAPESHSEPAASDRPAASREPSPRQG